MPKFRIAREELSGLSGRSKGVGIALALAALSLLAGAGTIAGTPLAGRIGALTILGPGKLGALGGQPLDSKGLPKSDIAPLARSALAGTPLASEPFYGLALARIGANPGLRDPGATALLHEALRRNPRYREARLLMMRRAVATNDLREAIDQMAVLRRLNSAGVDQLLTGLGNAISSERQVDEAIVALRPHGELYLPFLTGFARAGRPAPLTTRLIGQFPARILADPDIRRIAIAEMVRVQAFRQARSLWVRSLPAGAGGASDKGLVHSPDFTDRKAPPPFNWELVENPTGIAERVAGGGLSVGYYGRDPGLLASQLLTLSPGGYVAQLSYRSEGGTPGAMALQLRCAGNGAILGEVPLGARIGANQLLRLPFVVPADACGGQVLSLVGLSRETRDSQEVTVSKLTVERSSQQ